MLKKIFLIQLVLSLISFRLFASNALNSDSQVKTDTVPATAVQTEPRGNKAYVLTIRSAIVPVLTEYLRDGINRALKENAQCLIISLDTPGGLTETMRDIVQIIMNSEIPVIVYVTPSGAHAASAGVFIVYSADISAMAPATNIGSASPVNMDGKDISDTMKKKVFNDLISFLESIAKEKNKNISLVKDFIDTAANISAEYALKNNAIDLIASDINELLKKIDGKKILKNKKIYELKTASTKIIYYDIPFHRKMLVYISNPNVIYVLMMLGIWAMIYEFASPGFGFAGAFGSICLLISLFGAQALPITVTGVILIILGAGFIVLEIFITAHGIVGFIGSVAILFGSFMLFDDEIFRISLPLIIASAVFSFGFILFIAGAIIKTVKKAPSLGQASMINVEAIVKKELNPDGLIFYNGELWTALSETGCKIEVNQKVMISKMNGIKAVVRVSE